MTGNTTAVLIGLGFVSLVLPIGLVILARAEAIIERDHPVGSDGARPRPPAGDTYLPTPRQAPATESAADEHRTGAAAR